MHLNRFEAEISGATASNASANNMFIPHQLRPVVCANTYSQVQQKLQQHPPTIKSAPMLNNVPPPPIAPSFVPTFMAQEHSAPPEKSYSSEPTPVVLSSAPKLYTNRLSINPTEKPMAPQVIGILIDFILIVYLHLHQVNAFLFRLIFQPFNLMFHKSLRNSKAKK